MHNLNSKEGKIRILKKAASKRQKVVIEDLNDKHKTQD